MRILVGPFRLHWEAGVGPVIAWNASKHQNDHWASGKLYYHEGINPCNSYFTQWKCDTVEIVLIFLVRGLCAAPTLVRVQAKDGVFTTKTDAESPAGRGSAFGVGDLHQVDVAVGGNKVHAAQWVRANPSLPDRGPHLVPQFQSKLCEKEKQNGRSHEEEGNEFSELKKWYDYNCCIFMIS